MNSFTFYSPTKVIFGREAEKQVGEEIRSWGGSRVLVHFGGGSVRRSGLLDRVTASLEAAGLTCFLLGGVVPNPHLSLAREGIKLCRREKIDFLLAVGGGSAIDSAKCIALGVPYEGDVWDFYARKAEPAAALPVAAIPTLAAAGSETSSSSVITKEEGALKRGFNHALIRPRFTLMNPELLYTLPAYQTACGVTDIMMHTFERYFSPGGENEMTDRIAEALLRTVIQYGPVCIKEPENYQARSEIMWAGSLSHNHLTGLGRDGDWATHQIEHELGGMYDVAHGAGLAAVWPSWARYVCRQDLLRFARFGANVWGIPLNYEHPEETAAAAIAQTERFFTSIGMPVTLTELLGRTPEEKELRELTVKCTFFGARKIGGLMKLGEQEIFEIYQSAL